MWIRTVLWFKLGIGILESHWMRSNMHVSTMVPPNMDCCTICMHTIPNWGKFSWFFCTLALFRSTNCGTIYTQANTTQVYHVWRTRNHWGCSWHQGIFDWHSKGTEMLQLSPNLIFSFLKNYILSVSTLCSVCGDCSRCMHMSTTMAVCHLSVYMYSLLYMCAISSFELCTCMSVPFCCLCVGCADTLQGVTGDCSTTWEASERFVVSIVVWFTNYLTCDISGSQYRIPILNIFTVMLTMHAMVIDTKPNSL